MVTWKLREYLDTHKVSAYALTKTADLAPNTVYALARGDQGRVDLAVLDKVITGLEQLTGQTVTFNDLLEREAIAQSDADLAEAGLEDYAAALAEIDDDVPPEELAAWNAAFEQASRPHR